MSNLRPLVGLADGDSKAGFESDQRHRQMNPHITMGYSAQLRFDNSEMLICGMRRLDRLRMRTQQQEQGGLRI
jgi:hypothetical protein